MSLEILGDAAFVTTNSHMTLRLAICGLNAFVSLSSAQDWNSKVFNFKISFSKCHSFWWYFWYVSKEIKSPEV